MGPTWGPPGGPQVGHVNIAIWVLDVAMYDDTAILARE